MSTDTDGSDMTLESFFAAIEQMPSVCRPPAAERAPLYLPKWAIDDHRDEAEKLAVEFGFNGIAERPDGLPADKP